MSSAFAMNSAMRAFPSSLSGILCEGSGFT
jgi:hypothetical protein